MGTITCELEASYYAATAGDDKAAITPHGQRRLTFAAGNGKGKGRRLGTANGGGGALAWWPWSLRRRTTSSAVARVQQMQVFVRTLAGKSLALDVSPYDTVDAVKAKIQAKERVAAAQQRLVFAGQDLDGGGRTLAEYGVRREANLFLHLRLRGGACGSSTGAATAAGTGSSHRRVAAAVVGLLATMVAVATALNCFQDAQAGAADGLTFAMALLVFLWFLAVAGVNLITAGVCGSGRAESETLLSCTVRPVISMASAAFARRNLSVMGVAAASSAATGVVLAAAAADRVHCFAWFGLFLAAMSVVAFGVASR